MLPFLDLPPKTEYSILVTLALLTFFTVLFYTWDFIAKKDFLVNLKSRVNSWWIILTLTLIILSSKREIAFLSFAIISFIAFRELISKLDFNPKHGRTLLWAYLSIPIQYYFAYKAYFIPFLTFIPVGMLLLLPSRFILEDDSHESIKTFSHLQWSIMLTIFSISHIAYLMSLEHISSTPEGSTGLIYFLLVTTQLNDVSQFIAGKLFGKKKITPTISPNKTWAGFFGGIIGTVFFGYLFRSLLPLREGQVILLSVLIAISGFFGDLNISTIKRDLKIKDMGNLIPGHGGILDRIDSLIFTNLVFFYLIYYWIYA